MSFHRLMASARERNHLVSVLLELTYQCNLKCQFCYNDLNLAGKRLTPEHYRRLLDDLVQMGTLSVSFTGGEPLIYPHFYEVASYARDKGFSITVKSNALPLNRRNAERLKREVDPWQIETSLHGACAKTHDRQTLQNGSFKRLIGNIRTLRSLGMRVKINSALTRYNEHEVEAMLALADELDCPIQFDPVITPRDNGDTGPVQLTASPAGIENMYRLTIQHAMRAAEKTRAQQEKTLTVNVVGKNASFEQSPNRDPDRNPDPKSDHGQAIQTGRRLKNCGAGSTNLAIDPFGNVYPCVQFRRLVGNLHEHSIDRIWNHAEALKAIRELAFTARDQALANGMENYCMGTAELVTGDALSIHPQAKLNDRLFKRAKKDRGKDRTFESAS